ncbi:MAG: MATE family efflux transporter [Gammaproteobacteria bacterium]|nr:MATE family efflux transporter [Gammaproteobacteria bacterium]
MRNNEIDLTSGNFYKKIFLYSVPIFLSGALQLFYNAADLIVCGLFGSPNATAAISSTNSLSGFVVQFSMGISLGANAVMARAYGENDKEKGQRIVYSSMILSILLGLMMMLIGLFIARPALTLLKTTDDVIEDSISYLSIFFLSIPFSLIFNFGASLFRAIGDSRRPFIYLTIAGFTNIVLNMIFVIFLGLDVKGVALATVCSQLLSAILIVVALFRYNGFFHFKFHEIRMYKKELRLIFQVGLPAGLQNSIFSISNMLLQSSVNSLGTQAVSGYGAASSVESFVLQAMNSFSQAAMVFISANYGARKKENIKKVLYICMVYILLANLVVGGLVTIFGKQLLYLYVRKQDPELRILSINAGYSKLLVMVPSYFLCGYMHLFGFAMRGIGKSTTPMLATLIGVISVRVFWVYVMFPIEALHNVSGIAMSYPTSWLLTALINLTFFIIYFKRIDFGEVKGEKELKTA